MQAGHPDAHLHAAAAKAQVTAGAADAADVALTLRGARQLDRVLYGAPRVWNERIASALDLGPG